MGGLGSSHYDDCSNYDDYGINDIKDHRTNIASTGHNWKARQHIVSMLLSFMSPKHPGLSKGSQSLTCEFCLKEYGLERSLSRHLKERHSDKANCVTEDKYCSVCRKSFLRASHLKSHLKSAYHLRRIPSSEGSQKQSCELCDKKFVSKSALIRHLKEHHSDKANCTTEDKYCSVCQISFSRATSLKRHLESADHLKRIPSSKVSQKQSCELCDKKFVSKYALIRHLKEHHSDKDNCTTEDKYCSVCQKSFSRANSLKRHLESTYHLKRIPRSKVSTRPSSSSTNVQIGESSQSQAPRGNYAVESDVIQEQVYFCVS